jgi:hypothetical protein|tara:strand:- start:973 stop:1107 length:135 start_codon:yes stop_codon:yes gene_type:complete
MLIKKYHDSFYIRHTEAFVSSGSKRWLAQSLPVADKSKGAYVVG